MTEFSVVTSRIARGLGGHTALCSPNNPG